MGGRRKWGKDKNDEGREREGRWEKRCKKRRDDARDKLFPEQSGTTCLYAE